MRPRCCIFVIRSEIGKLLIEKSALDENKARIGTNGSEAFLLVISENCET
jgi:hypothetical protein